MEYDDNIFSVISKIEYLYLVFNGWSGVNLRIIRISMKRGLLVATILLVSFSSFEQGWQWARASLCDRQEFYVAKSNRLGNILCAGYNEDTLCVDAHIFYNTNGSRPVLAKYDTMGNLSWIVASGLGYAGVIDLAVDSEGNSYMYGYFLDSIQFDSYHLYGPTQPSCGFSVFVTKYDSNGNVVWARNIASGINWITGYPGGIDADPAGNLYISGAFCDSVLQIGSYVFHNNDSSGTNDIFVAKLDSSGNTAWAKSYGGKGMDHANRIAVDHAGYLYLSGTYTSPTLSLDTTTLINPYTTKANPFLAKLDTGGNILWVRNSTCNAAIENMTIDLMNNIYIAGYIRDTTAIFGSHTIHVPWNTSINDFAGAALLVQYSENGDVNWARALPTVVPSGFDCNIIYGVVTDDCNNVWASGHLDATMKLDSAVLNRLSNGYFIDASFLVEFNESGQLVTHFALAAGGDDNSGLTTDKHGNIYLVGDYLIDRPFNLGSVVLPVGYERFFVAKYKTPNCKLIADANEFSNKSIFLSPNPATTELTIQTSGTFYPQAIITIYDLAGRIMERRQLSGSSTTISVSSLPAGIYVCRIDADGQGVVVRKLVVMR